MNEARKTRRAARQERVKKRQAAKTQRMEQRQAKRLERAGKRQEARAQRGEQRREARAQRQAVRQQARLGKLAERKGLSEQLENLGAVAEGQKSAAAIRQATTNAKMRKYVENQGEQISEDAEPEEIAAQVQDLREEEIQDTQDALNENLEEGDEPYTSDDAEAFLYDMYDADSFDGDDVNNYDCYTAAMVKSAAKQGVARRIQKAKQKARKIRLSDVTPKQIQAIMNSKYDDYDSENYDLYDVENFDPITMMAIGKASKKGLEVIAKKRAAQGKKTFGMTPEELQKLITPKASGSATSDIGKVIEAGTEEYKTQKIKEESPNLMIIVGILVIVGIYIGMRKK